MDDVDDRYAKTLASAEAFLVTQLGVSAFSWVPAPEGQPAWRGHWQARSFNIMLFPAVLDDQDFRWGRTPGGGGR